MTSIKSILHPTDFSAHSDAAFRVACSLARDYGAKLLVAHVRQVPVPLTGNPEAFPVEPPELEAALRARLYAIKADDSRVVVEHYLLVGDEGAELLNLAAEKGCDLIVMGTHGRTGLARVLMGSVAETVLRKATCPVLTVKYPPAAAGAPPAQSAKARTTVTIS